MTVWINWVDIRNTKNYGVSAVKCHLVLAFYLSYRLIQTYNKTNGIIRRHFGKQMTKEAKLRVHSITAKAAVKFDSEAWVLKKRDEQRLEAAQMKFLRYLLGITKARKGKKSICEGETWRAEHSFGNKTIPTRVATPHRMGTERIPRQTLKCRPQGKRSIGRPRKRWKEQRHLEG
jgi:hypothetical protein